MLFRTMLHLLILLVQYLVCNRHVLPVYINTIF